MIKKISHTYCKQVIYANNKIAEVNKSRLEQSQKT